MVPFACHIVIHPLSLLSLAARWVNTIVIVPCVSHWFPLAQLICDRPADCFLCGDPFQKCDGIAKHNIQQSHAHPYISTWLVHVPTYVVAPVGNALGYTFHRKELVTSCSQGLCRSQFVVQAWPMT